MDTLENFDLNNLMRVSLPLISLGRLDTYQETAVVASPSLQIYSLHSTYPLKSNNACFPTIFPVLGTIM